MEKIYNLQTIKYTNNITNNIQKSNLGLDFDKVEYAR